MVCRMTIAFFVSIFGVYISLNCSATLLGGSSLNTSDGVSTYNASLGPLSADRCENAQAPTHQALQLVLPEEDVESLRIRVNEAFDAERDHLNNGFRASDSTIAGTVSAAPAIFGAGTGCCSEAKPNPEEHCSTGACPSKVPAAEPAAAASHCASAESSGSCSMPMYFENTVKTVILFHFWKTTTGTQYAVSLFFIFVLSLMTVFLKAFRNKLNCALLQRPNGYHPTVKYGIMYILAFVVTFMDFAMMLVVMTFNVGIVLVVCSAYALGYIFTCCPLGLSEAANGSRCTQECPADCCC
ncbi:Ctr copper transporter family protein [Babesia bovis T2Bo]|uniref:Copper transport protein n=1 Tax=Babesia bovis TaxID=5865 RepID=A7AU51_BABBO|nr:Ctr copper transporter family protein [Babesia bovis T2Bo]EDO06462.1 Ctr copper transporter family protein [Babesia bovis T2Bo]|eukprot:XP_001610030.1 hypothetical protein [Babesia bovis T2Bo]